MINVVKVGSLIKREELEKDGFNILKPAGETTGAKLVIVENINDNIKYVFEQLPDGKTFKVYWQLTE